VIAHRRRRGFALLAVLWASALVATIAATLAYAMRVETSLSSDELTRARAEVLADSGIRLGIMASISPAYHQGWPPYGVAHEVMLPGGGVRVSIQPETGRIDLNRAPRALLRGLLRSAAMDLRVDPDRLADAILDWRDRDSNPRAGGAEDPAYARAGRPYGARDGPFLTVEELNQVLGMNAELYRRLAPALTVYSGRPAIDPGSASRLVLRAVPGLSLERIDAFLSDRVERRAAGLPARPALLGVSPYLAVLPSNVLRISAVVTVGDGISVRRAAHVRIAPRTRHPYMVLAWGDAVERTPTAAQNAR